MDTTPEYIKKCEKSKEIQAVFIGLLPPGTFWARESEGYCSQGVTGYSYGRLPEWIILPRQDQLQEMMGYKTAIVLLNVFHQWVLKEDNDLKSNVTIGASMESLWLAFVMEKEFGKVWDSTKEEWVAKV